MDQKSKAKYLMKNYGLSYEAWEELIKNGCWICGRKEGRLCVDHRHIPKFKLLSPEDKVKEVRGCLCFLCNTMLQGVEKRKNGRYFLERMVSYFQVFKCKGDL